MTELTHHHSRVGDPQKVVLPGWLKTLVGTCVALVLATVATLTWFDNRYLSNKDATLLKETFTGKLEEIKRGQDDLKEDLKDIKRALYRSNPR